VLIVLLHLAAPAQAAPGEAQDPALTIALMPVSERLGRALRAALSAWQMDVVRVEGAQPHRSGSLQAMSALAREQGADAIVWIVRGRKRDALWVYDTRTDAAATRFIPRRKLTDADAAALSLSVKTLLRAWTAPATRDAPPAPETSTWQQIESATIAPNAQSPAPEGTIPTTEELDATSFQDDLTSELPEQSLTPDDAEQALADRSVQQLSDADAQAFREEQARATRQSIGATDQDVAETNDPLPPTTYASWQVSASVLARLRVESSEAAQPRSTLRLRYFPGAGLNARRAAPWIALSAEAGLPSSIERAEFHGRYWELGGSLAVGLAQPLGRRVRGLLGLGFSVQRSTLSGTVVLSGDDIRRSRLSPALALQPELELVFGELSLGLLLGAGAFLARQRYEIDTAELLETQTLFLLAGATVGLSL
jgi:hypothetical protein